MELTTTEEKRGDIIVVIFISLVFLVGFSLGKFQERGNVNQAYLNLLTQAERAVVYLEQTDSIILQTLPPTETVVFCAQ